MEVSSFNYQIDYERVRQSDVALSETPECVEIGPTWVVGIIMSFIMVAAFNTWHAFWIVLVLTFLVHMYFRYERNEEEKENIAEKKTKQNRYAAENLSSQLNNMLRDANSLKQELPHLLNNATKSLESARYEFSDSAFSPFWDCIEKATKYLAIFNNNIQEIHELANNYYSVLGNQKNHNFPSFLPEQAVFPDPEPVINELNTVVRPGLTNYQFANIWEQRKTQKILIRGFGTLGESISNMSSSIYSSITKLHDTISSGTAQMIDQQVMSAESFERYSKNHVSLMEDQIKTLKRIDDKHK